MCSDRRRLCALCSVFQCVAEMMWSIEGVVGADVYLCAHDTGSVVWDDVSVWTHGARTPLNVRRHARVVCVVACPCIGVG